MQGTAEEILIHRKELLRVKRNLNQIYNRHTGRSLEEIERDTDRDNFMTAEEAREYNLIDRVVWEMGETGTA